MVVVPPAAPDTDDQTYGRGYFLFKINDGGSTTAISLAQRAAAMTIDKKLCAIVDEYRNLAAEAEHEARNPIPHRYRDAYRKIAQHWAELVAELEAVMRDGDQTPTLH